LKRGLLVTAALGALVAALPAHAQAQQRGPRTEVVAELSPPPLARAFAGSRVLTSAVKNRRLDLRSPTSTAYLRRLDAEQRIVAARIRRAVPAARIRWRYQVVLDGLAVYLPESAIPRLRRVAGVARVTEGTAYTGEADSGASAIEAPFLWGPTYSTVGQGLKIGIIDDGIDQTHPYFDPSGYAMPAGFPKGNRKYTTAKVIVARAFAPPHPGYRNAALPFDPKLSFHGTHVGGIAAGDRGTTAVGGQVVTGIAPAAYLGNYKVLTVPAASYGGADGNSPEIARAIEAAVRDGMDVINLSLGEPEVTPSRDLAVRALNAAVDAGVVAAVSAGNSFDSIGRGSIWSPGSAAKAITVAAATNGREFDPADDFSSSGPTPLSLEMKPEVTAPGYDILSAVPRRDGTWASFDGTSMAAPHVAGGAALLLQHHPTWTPAQVKSALELTGRPVTERGVEAPTTREGGGMIDLGAANDPRVFAGPSGLSFKLLQPGRTAVQVVTLTDAGGGAGTWNVQVEPQPGAGSVDVSAPASVEVPGSLTVRASAPSGAQQGEATGFVVLSQAGVTRRIPYWLRVAAPALGREQHSILPKPGLYRGDTRGRPSLVSSYRYPDDPSPLGVPTRLDGPEQVFRFNVKRSIANFGVHIVTHAPGVAVVPRIVAAGNENRLMGEAALPYNVNPYFRSYGERMPAAGVDLPGLAGYDVVFDSPTSDGAGRFRFRFWVNDTTPPSIRMLARSISRGAPLRLRVTDGGSGVWPESLAATIDGERGRVGFNDSIATVATGSLARGVHRLTFSASDWQETRNHENVYRILPNTRTLQARFRVS
jgi:subtilisin family serine protease